MTLSDEDLLRTEAQLLVRNVALHHGTKFSVVYKLFTQQPICLDPSTNVVRVQNHLHFNAQKFSFPGNTVDYDFSDTMDARSSIETSRMT